ncbi:MAG: YiiD C-terminal domain-containing protein [Thiolinea sp.]
MNPLFDAAQSLQQTIRSTIPMSQHMGYEITALSETSIQVSAPLENNVNIHGTAFAGSIYSVATLTAWALCYHMLQSTHTGAELVLGEGQIKYRAPIKADLQCTAEVSAEEREDFLNTLTTKGRSRLLVKVNINNAAFWEGKLAAKIPAKTLTS